MKTSEIIKKLTDLEEKYGDREFSILARFYPELIVPAEIMSINRSELMYGGDEGKNYIEIKILADQRVEILIK